MITIVDVLCNNYCNKSCSPVYPYWGLGDLIRGIIALYQFCDQYKNKYKLIVDISLHQISKFIKGDDNSKDQQISKLIQDNKHKIRMIPTNEYNKFINNIDKNIINEQSNNYNENTFDYDYYLINNNDVNIRLGNNHDRLWNHWVRYGIREKRIHRWNEIPSPIINTINKSIIFFGTNAFCNKNRITDDCKQYIRNILQPTDEFKLDIDNKLQEIYKFLGKTSYNILHYRMGDNYLVKKQSNKIDIKINPKILDSCVFLSDSAQTKEYIKNKYKNVYVNDIILQHLGLSCNNDDIVKQNLIEFYLLIHAKCIYTYSIYGLSNFVKWVHYIYNIPLIKILKLK